MLLRHQYEVLVFYLAAENIPIDEFVEQILRLFVLLVNDCANGKSDLKAPSSQPERMLHTKCSPEKLRDLPSKEPDLQILDSDFGAKAERDTVIVLSEDEIDARDDVNTLSDSHGGEASNSQSAERASQMNEASRSSFDIKGLVDKKMNIECIVDKSSMVKGKFLQGKGTKKSSDTQKNSCLTKPCAESLGSQMDNLVPHQSLKNTSAGIRSSSSHGVKKVSAKSDRVIKELVFDAKDDPWEFALKSARNNQSHLGKPNTSGPKRKVIQLNLPVENRVSQSNRLRSGGQRFKPVRLDDWFRPILEMDYYATVGLASSIGAGNLKEVPVYFQSPDDYVAVFRPLVLEELKAQLHSSFVEMASPDEMSCGSLSVISVERVDDFHLVRCLHDDKDLEGSRMCVENDLVLITRQPFQNSHEVHMVGKVYVLSFLMLVTLFPRS